MNAMIFAAGLGTRLRPITDSIPKAMVEVGGVKMIDRAINNVRRAGAERIVVNVHHHADVLSDYLCAYDDVIISDESDCLLDTGGGLLAARRWLDSSLCLVCNADILTDFDLSEIVSAHDISSRVATLLVDVKRESSRKLLFDDNLIMKGWTNVKSGETKPSGLDADGLIQAAFGGIHVVSPEIFPALQSYADRVGDVFSITSFYIDSCREKNVYGFVSASECQWFDVGSCDRLATARRLFIE